MEEPVSAAAEQGPVRTLGRSNSHQQTETAGKPVVNHRPGPAREKRRSRQEPLVRGIEVQPGKGGGWGLDPTRVALSGLSLIRLGKIITHFHLLWNFNPNSEAILRTRPDGLLIGRRKWN
jgi:hypothetical protein